MVSTNAKMMIPEEQLICECNLVNWRDLIEILEVKYERIFSLADLKSEKIIGHGCGQCLNNWEYELKNLIESFKK